MGVSALETAAISTSRIALESLYVHLPERFPPLYEELLVSYRWLEVELVGFVKLYANPIEPTFDGLLSQMTCDKAMVEILFSRNLLPFGTASDGCYDPICFDRSRVLSDGESPIVRVEHESMLCEGQLGRVQPVSPTFRAFVAKILEEAEQSL